MDGSAQSHCHIRLPGRLPHHDRANGQRAHRPLLQHLTRVGYNFTGWNTKADGSAPPWPTAPPMTLRQTPLFTRADQPSPVHTITASVSGGHGTITPTSKTVNPGDPSGDFTITADEGLPTGQLYRTADNGADVNARECVRAPSPADSRTTPGGYVRGYPHGVVDFKRFRPPCSGQHGWSSITSNSASAASITGERATARWSIGTSGGTKTITGIKFGGHDLTFGEGKDLPRGEGFRGRAAAA